MIKIEVKSLPLREVIRDIADAFKTSYYHSCGEYILEVPEHLGKGSIKGINFDGGMGLVEYNCLFNQPIEFHFTLNDVHPLKFLYCLEGSLDHRFANSEISNKIAKYKQAIVASSSFTGHVLSFKKDEATIIKSLEIVRSVFKSKIECELLTIDVKLQELFNDIIAQKPFFYDGFYSLKLAHLFRKMDLFDANDFIKKLFLEGKCYEVLTEQIKQYQDDLEDVSNRSILRRSEIDQIDAAAKLISYQISQKITINDIAGAVGLNPNKLQEGFQDLYGMTVNQYIQRARISLISNLILNTDYSISEIVHLSGLSSKSYLSKIFKEEYGKSPSQFRKEYMKEWLEKKKGFNK
ncbi:MAG: helix-turn-helix domain-containing protein [Flavobacteriales bacterium]